MHQMKQVFDRKKNLKHFLRHLYKHDLNAMCCVETSQFKTYTFVSSAYSSTFVSDVLIFQSALQGRQSHPLTFLRTGRRFKAVPGLNGTLDRPRIQILNEVVFAQLALEISVLQLLAVSVKVLARSQHATRAQVAKEHGADAARGKYQLFNSVTVHQQLPALTRAAMWATAPASAAAPAPTALTLPPSGIPHSLHNFGVARLDPIPDFNTLMLALKDYGITADLSDGELDGVLWAKNELWRKFERRHFPGLRNSSAASEASVSVTTADDSVGGDVPDNSLAASCSQARAHGRGSQGGRGRGRGRSSRDARGGRDRAAQAEVEVEDSGSEEGSEEEGSDGEDGEESEESGENSNDGGESGWGSCVEVQEPAGTSRGCAAPPSTGAGMYTIMRVVTIGWMTRPVNTAPAAAEVSETQLLRREMRERLDAQERALELELRRRREAKAQMRARQQAVQTAAQTDVAGPSGTAIVEALQPERAERKDAKYRRRRGEIKLHSDGSGSESSSAEGEEDQDRVGKGKQKKSRTNRSRSSSSSAHSSDS
eukprot:5117139-Pleurochrysis_carterae.AAC.2